MNDLNYYWINLDKAKDRRIFMENQFEFRVNKTNLLASFKNKLKPQIIYSE